VDRPPFLGHGSGPLKSDSGTSVQCLFNAVSDRYFETLGIPMLAGHDFTKQEIERGDAPILAGPGCYREAHLGGAVVAVVGEHSFTVIGVVKTVRST
jgi:hypothetical protein